MRKGKNYPLFCSGMYGFWAGSNSGPPRRCWVRTSFLYQSLPFALNSGTNYSDEATYEIISPGVAALDYNFPVLGFLCHLQMILDATTTRIYGAYFEVLDPFTNKLQLVNEFPQSPWSWPAAANLPGTTVVAIQDTPYTDVQENHYGVMNYGHLPPPWPA